MASHYALFQRELDELDSEAVGRALSAVPHLVPADALRLVQRAHGVLVDRLERAEAEALRDALANEGIAVASVEQAWLNLPPAVSCRRLDPTPHGLEIRGGLEPIADIPWPAVLVLAAGTCATPTRTVKPEQARDRSINRWDASGRYIMAGSRVSGVEVEYGEKDQTILEIVVDMPARYRVRPDQFDYSGLGSKRGHSARQNFALLIRALIENASRMGQSHALGRFDSDIAQLPRYPHRANFERELAWRVWRYQGPGLQWADTAGPYRAHSQKPRVSAPLCPSNSIASAASTAPTASTTPTSPNAQAPVAPAVQNPSNRSQSLTTGPQTWPIASSPNNRSEIASDISITIAIGATVITVGTLLFGPVGAWAGAALIPFVFRRLRKRRS